MEVVLLLAEEEKRKVGRHVWRQREGWSQGRKGDDQSEEGHAEGLCGRGFM